MKKLLLILAFIISATGTWATGYPSFSAPSVTSITVAADGTSVTVVYSRPMTASSNTGMTLSTGGSCTYSSGTGTSTVVYTAASTIGSGVTVTGSQTGSALTDPTGYPLTFSGQSATNNSTQSSCAGGSAGQLGATGTAQDGAINSASIIVYKRFTAGSANDGLVSYAHGYTYAVTGTARVGIFSSTGTLLASTAAFTASENAAATAFHQALSSSQCIVSGTEYILGIWLHDTSDSWVGTAVGDWSESGGYYSQSLATFGSFTPADTATNYYNLILTVNSLSGSFE